MKFNMEQSKIKKDSTAEYTFTELPGEPKIVCRPATMANSDFMVALLKSGDIMNGSDGEDKITEAQKKAQAELFAEHVIVDWSDMDEICGGKTPKCTQENRIDFLMELQSEGLEYVWTKFNLWVGSNKNFYLIDKEEKAGK